MIHIIQMDDTTLTGRKSTREFRHVQKDFNSSITGTPEGYMTSAEFRQRAVLKVEKFCKENGIL